MAACIDCRKKIGFLDSVGGRCSDCHFKVVKLTQGDREDASNPTGKDTSVEASEADLSRIILSTEAAPDLTVAERLDVITAEFAVGMNVLTDIFNAWRDFFGGRSKSYQNTLKDARKTVLLELRREAHRLGADAVLGVDLDYSEISGGGKSMLFMVASGTAVKLAHLD